MIIFVFIIFICDFFDNKLACQRFFIIFYKIKIAPKMALGNRLIKYSVILIPMHYSNSKIYYLFQHYWPFVILLCVNVV